ncbi:MAG: aldehyde ferredoxin oxidoreductase family protein, partial [Methanomassiliicoccales archaeon]
MTKKLGGYAGKLLRIDLTKEKVKTQELSKEICKKYIGGRGSDAKVLFHELSPKANPLGKENILCISTGPITGLLGPTTGRVNVAAKSPLTDIYGNSNAGTNFGPELKYAGYDGLIIKGRATKPVYLNIQDDVVEIKDAGKLWGEGVFETTLSLQDKYNGYETKVAAIGPAAERGVLFGSLIFDLWDAAGRTGMGTVMASKNLKAIAVSGTGALSVADPKRYKEVIEDGWLGLVNDPGFRMGEHQALGTSVCVGWGNAQGWLPTRNFRESVFEGAESISGEEFRDKYSIKLAPIPGGRACLSCPNRCKRFGRIDSGKYAGTRGNIEFEGVAAFGSKCGVDDLAAVFHAFMLANDYGMDCVSCGNMIATFMELNEEGIIDSKKTDKIDLKFGNADAMVEMVHRIANQEGKLGRLGAQGAFKATKKIGNGADKYTSCIKGIDTIACDPRAAKGFGFTFAVSSRGSDHLRAHPVFEMIRLDGAVGKELFGSEESCTLKGYKGKANMVFWHENLSAITDSIGSCRFMHASYYAQYPVPELRAKYSKKKRKSKVHSIKYHEWLSAATGLDIGYEDLLRIGDRIINLERAINTRIGIRRKDDTLPQRFMKDPLPSGPAKGETFQKKQLDKMVDNYYELRGWDKTTGLHLKEKLSELDMKDVLSDLQKRKLVVSS